MNSHSTISIPANDSQLEQRIKILEQQVSDMKVLVSAAYNRNPSNYPHIAYKHWQSLMNKA